MRMSAEGVRSRIDRSLRQKDRVQTHERGYLHGSFFFMNGRMRSWTGVRPFSLHECQTKPEKSKEKGDCYERNR